MTSPSRVRWVRFERLKPCRGMLLHDMGDNAGAYTTTKFVLPPQGNECIKYSWNNNFWEQIKLPVGQISFYLVIHLLKEELRYYRLIKLLSNCKHDGLFESKKPSSIYYCNKYLWWPKERIEILHNMCCVCSLWRIFKSINKLGQNHLHTIKLIGQPTNLLQQET